ncbi:hypothetical protein FIBSPDRAFT_1043328 [Athelia psychrophila]|uniref:Cupin 2 conserved barrel domain-containing protein n=1 Tax=Athelia psychrophila TaxID=1759441 RepID=A0A166L9Y7_9AGAM|nr:hypothetical protein FIBSPDRAFT_1043328 [Fibularhizoctonia sp. CBS 109695]
MWIPSYPGDERFDFGDGAYMILHHNGPDNLVSTNIIPAASSLFIPYHLHPKSNETMKVFKGKLSATINGKLVVTTPDSGGVLHIPAGTRHGFQKVPGQEDLIFSESTEPWPDRKKVFFSDLMLGCAAKEVSIVGAMASFYRDDDIVLCIGDWSPLWLGRLIVFLVGGLIGDKLGFAPRGNVKAD